MRGIGFIYEDSSYQYYSRNTVCGRKFTIEVAYTYNNKKKGEIAGWKTRRGYWMVMLGGKKFMSHRVIWALIHGEWPSAQIDHINGDPSDNRIANLRLASQSQNNFNRSMFRNNTTGYQGVTYEPSRNKYKASIRIDGKTRNIGRFDSALDASIAYQKECERTRGEFHRKPENLRVGV